MRRAVRKGAQKKKLLERVLFLRWSLFLTYVGTLSNSRGTTDNDGTVFCHGP